MALSEWLDPETSTLGSFLRFLDRPGQVVRNLIRGEPGAAGRQLLDIVGEAVDVALPGDIIPGASKPEDYVYSDELLGIEDQPWYIRYPIGIAGDIVTDPLSFVSFGGTAAARKIGAGVQRASDFAEVGARAAGRDAGAELLQRAAAATKARKAGASIPFPEAGTIEREVFDLVGKRRNLSSQIGKLTRKLSTADEASAAGVREALKQARASQKQLGGALNRARRSYEATAAKTLGEPMLLQGRKQALRPLLERELKSSARRSLAKQPTGVAGTIDEIVAKIGDDITPDRIREVLGAEPYSKMFNQGGLSAIDMLGGQRLKSADWAFEKVASGARAIANRVPPAGRELGAKIATKADKAWSAVKNTLGWNFLDANSKALAARHAATASQHGNAAKLRVARIFENATDATDNIVAQAFDNLAYNADGTVSTILDAGQEGIEEVVSRLNVLQANPRMATGVDLGKVNWDQAKRIVRELTDENHRLWDEWVANGVLTDVADVGGRASYLRRAFSGKTVDEAGNVVRNFDEFDDVAQRATGNVKSGKGRVIQSSEELASYLNAQPGLNLERSAFRRAMGRAEQQGVGVAQAQLAKEILGRSDVILGDAGVRNKVAQGIAEIGNTDQAMKQMLDKMWGGMTPRGPVLEILAKVNRVFKPSAVYGLFAPRISAIVRNQVGGIWQALSAGGIDLASQQGKQAVRNLQGALGKGISQAFGKGKAWGGKLRDDLNFFDSLAAVPPEQAMAMAAKRGGVYADAIREGVLETYVNAEQLLQRTMRNPKLRKLAEKADVPGEMFNYLESAMRWGMFKGLRETGYGSKAAADLVRDSFLDYGIHSSANRTLRDLVPFAAFTSQTIPQQMKFLARSPAAGVALASLMRGGEEPVSPWVSDQPYLQVGEQEYLTSLGLPVEALNVIPQFSGGPRELGADVRKNILGSAHPLIKAAYGYVTGEDPYFSGSPYGSYARTPELFQAMGAPQKSEAARIYREFAQTGLAQPLETPLRMAGQALDVRKTPAQRLLNLLTGARIETSDPDRAAVQIIQEQLRKDPEARVFRSYYGGSETTENLIAELRAAKKRLKEKREAREAIAE